MKTRYLATKCVDQQVITVVADYYTVDVLREDGWYIKRIKEDVCGYIRDKKRAQHEKSKI